MRRCPELEAPKPGEPIEPWVNATIDQYYQDCAIPHDTLIKYETPDYEPSVSSGFNPHANY